MKIFMTFLLATIAINANTNADISLVAQSGYVISSPEQHQIQPQDQSISIQSLSPTTNQYLPPLPALHSMPRGFPVAPITTLRSGRRYRPRVKIPKKTLVTKSFFIHSAPEESDDEIEEEFSQLPQTRKHYNVLFVKTPSQTSLKKLKSLKTLEEQKTVVYVLAKKTTASDLQEAIAEAPQVVNKPEVYFIKYRTPEEAAHAQREIQAQYDSLGGSSTISDEGTSPMTSVVGSLDESEEEEINESQQQLPQQLPQQPEIAQEHQQEQLQEQLAHSINNIIGSVPSVSNQYLPPSHF